MSYKVLKSNGEPYFAITKNEIREYMGCFAMGKFTKIARKHVQYCNTHNVDLYVYINDELFMTIHERDMKE